LLCPLHHFRHLLVFAGDGLHLFADIRSGHAAGTLTDFNSPSAVEFGARLGHRGCSLGRDDSQALLHAKHREGARLGRGQIQCTTELGGEHGDSDGRKQDDSKIPVFSGHREALLALFRAGAAPFANLMLVASQMVHARG